MPVSARLSNKLYETFGEDAARDMVDWMQRMDAQPSEMRELFDQQFARLSLLSEQIGDVRREFDGLRREVSGQISGFRAEFRHDLDLGLARLETKIEQRTADLMKWSFVFWVGAVGATALLAGVLKS